MLDQGARWGEPERPTTITIHEVEPDAPEAGYRTTAKPASPTIVIQRRWTGRNLGCLIPFIIFWFSALAVWYMIALGEADPSIMSLVCPLFHIAAGLLLLYVALRQLLNVSRIRLTDTQLTCQTSPIGSRRVEAYDVNDIKHASQRRAGQNGGYLVELVLHSGAVRPLQAVADAAEALYLVWAISAWLDRHRAD